MFAWLILHSVIVLALALLVGLVGRWFRLGPAGRHALWLVVLVKFLMPPVVSWPWALPALWPSSAECTREQVPVTREEEPDASSDPGPLLLPPEPLVWAIEESPSPVAGDESPSAPQPPAPAPSSDPPPWNGWPLVLIVWLMGSALVAGRHLFQGVRLRRLLVEARPAPEWLVREVAELAAQLGVRAPGIRVLAGLGSPVVWAWGWPRLLWPEGLEERLLAEGRRAVLVHELAHLRRRDHWVGWLLLVGSWVWWWHPLLGLIRRQLSREAERACDAWVVAMLPGARRAFAEALLEVCERKSVPVLAVPTLGAVTSRSDLERRLVMVMREQVPCRVSKRLVVGAGLLALLILPAWSVGQNAPPARTAPAANTKPVDVVDLQNLATLQLGPFADNKPADTAPGKPGTAKSGGKPVNTAEQDKKLAEVEAKLQALLKEVQALRKAGKGPAPATTTATPYPPVRGYTPAFRNDVAGYYSFGGMGHGSRPQYSTAPVEITLTRVTYKLPAAKAEAISKFLREHVKGSVLETKVEGDSLTVTTTPAMQRSIAQIVALVQAKPPAKAGMFGRPQ
jgi:beta-lactamase regulating signal transducer with metallopeptidase domain